MWGISSHVGALQKHYVECRTRYLGALDILKKSLGPTTDHERALQQFGHWPPITADVLLRYIASTAPICRSAQWKTCLVSLTLLLLELQRARRLLRFCLDGLEEEFLNELDNEQCDGWSPEEYPDWLLVQACIYCPRVHLYLCRFLSLSGSRKFSHSARSGRSCDGTNVATSRAKHCNAGQHGRREVICDCPDRSRRSC